MRNKIASLAIYGLSTGIGLVAFIYPFLVPSMRNATLGQAHSNDAPLLITTLIGLCFIVLLLEVQGQAVNAKFVALLGVLVSMNALLRFLDVAIPGPGGLSPIFFLIILTGYIFGGRFGFLMGAMTLLVSALITGAVGPWLPYQMFTAGWVGITAPLCRPAVRVFRAEGHRLEVLVLAVFAGLWGLVFGIIMNVWFWPFATGPTDQYWQPGISFLEVVRRYAAFYIATSLAWDILRAVGNLLLMLALGEPVLKALRRFHRRFAFDHRPARQTLREPRAQGYQSAIPAAKMTPALRRGQPSGLLADETADDGERQQSDRLLQRPEQGGGQRLLGQDPALR